MLDTMETAEDPMKDLVVIDADGHVEEHDLTFSDKYLDPAFRAQRPRVVATDGLAYWMIEEQLFPRRLGRGCHNLGTPTSYGGNGPSLPSRSRRAWRVWSCAALTRDCETWMPRIS